MRRAGTSLALAGLVVALTACASYNPAGSSGSGSDSATPPSGGQELEFTGYLFRLQGQTWICDAIAESFPPQCAGKSYRVTGVDFSGIDHQEEQGVLWTNGRVTLKGLLAADGETLMVSANPVVRGGGPPPPTVGGQPGSAPG